MENKKGKGRQQLILLIAFFAAPIILAIVMYNTIPEGGPTKTKNYGDLITPARPLIDINLKSEVGKEYKFSDMKKTWIMIYIGSAECDKVCESVLYKMRQSRLAQRGEHLRIKRLYISTSGKAKDSLNKVLKEHPGLEVVSGNTEEINSVLNQFKLENKAAAKSADRLYLVDPFGNLMMSYESDFDAKGLIKDVELLLKISRIG
ncbi:MAG: SCO family protein [Gammaproteobacteria bacterium]|nr:SCO family protein [Gammaproteobacteria bacterium]MDH5659482.1 SCO family protein [Gammaproteobacteria bacterium]